MSIVGKVNATAIAAEDVVVIGQVRGPGVVSLQLHVVRILAHLGLEREKVQEALVIEELHIAEARCYCGVGSILG